MTLPEHGEVCCAVQDGRGLHLHAVRVMKVVVVPVEQNFAASNTSRRVALRADRRTSIEVHQPNRESLISAFVGGKLLDQLELGRLPRARP